MIIVKGEHQVSVSKTKLNENQIARLYNALDLKNQVRSAYLCVVKGTNVKKIAINYVNGEKESFFPMDDDLDLIINGITLTRNKA